MTETDKRPLVERLRAEQLTLEWSNPPTGKLGATLLEAAAELERLQARQTELETALRGASSSPRARNARRAAGQAQGVTTPKDGNDFPLWLLVAAKEALFCCTEDPSLEDAHKVLSAIKAAAPTQRTE